MGKPQGGLTKWFKEDLCDVKTARSVVGLVKKRKHDLSCRPKLLQISKAEARKKTYPKAVKWSVTASVEEERKQERVVEYIEVEK